MKFSRKICGLLVLLAAAFNTPAAAHNYHTSLTRIDHNQQAKSLEIEINLFNHDLERALEAKNKKAVDIEKSKDIDQLLGDYLAETFVIIGKDGEPKKITWIGKEIKVDLTTVFIEIKGIEDLKSLKLRNKIFFESFSEQINLVTVHDDERKFDLIFKSGDDFKEFAAVKPK